MYKPKIMSKTSISFERINNKIQKVFSDMKVGF